MNTRSRFVLLIAAAIVFAPGWSGRAAPSHEPGHELAGRVLAPTVDEGTLQGPSVKKQVRAGRSETDLVQIGAAITGFLLAAVALTVLWFLLTALKDPAPVSHIAFSPSRAPPHLQPS